MMFVMKRIICSKSWKTYSNSDPVSQLRAQACKSFLKQIPLQKEPEVMNSDMQPVTATAPLQKWSSTNRAKRVGMKVLLFSLAPTGPFWI
ncbi:hypothetical protein LWI29_003187 [Acer saccharum]|uniref:Uncharacterized protein n=1 Tax=Acer saccharum TaxID=4024 RepID=A0AA39VRP9_ACESA|nr:hypothetical protein LWI29_003187 [Acer saccharum]